ncbi:uncharacterized protein LOC128349717 [Hemicordylus capensis]|uniref:uncharacterized protein LOC128349717 n=1 Tax=Hemicordylus capensis TaxID=884348 RepID=UPI0023027897|nr:uncharacterized protein LOC128349717 [Hemicordylus capensis]XP_053162486.1 uncharacterized protein LOC128349717 [Hemicordylus capensis]
MNEDGVLSGRDNEEEGTATDEEHSPGCFHASALCCCISRRRIYLPGRRPRDRKKRNWKKKDAGEPCLNEIMLEEGPQNMGQPYWRTISEGELEIAQAEAKLALPSCSQPYDTKTPDQHLLVPMHAFKLEERQKECEGRNNTKTQGKAQQQKEGLDSLSVLSLEAEKKNLVAAVSEGVPLEEGKESLAMPAKKPRQSERPELQRALLQGAAYEKEQQEGGENETVTLESVPCKKELKQHHHNALFQERQQSTDLEQFNSTPIANEKKSQGGQNDISTDSEGVTSLQELPNQPGIPCNEEHQLLEQQPFMGITHKVEKQVMCGEMNSVSKGDAHSENQDYQDLFHQEVQQLVELKCPDILPTMGTEEKQEEQGMLHHVDLVTETSPKEMGNDCQHLLEQGHQIPVIPQAISFSFQGTTYRKKQEEEQDTRSFPSDNVFSKTEDNQYDSHQVAFQAVAPKNITTLSLGTTFTINPQKLAHMNYAPEDAVVYITEQKHLETQKLLLLEQISTQHHSITDEKEQQGGLDHAHFGSKEIACIEEQEYQEPVVFEDISMLTDNISYEKEQQRKLDCGDTGPEGICDKDDEDHQAALYLEMQQPLVLAKLSSLSLNENSEIEQCVSKDNTDIGGLERHSLKEQHVGWDGQSRLLSLMPSKEEAATQEVQQPPASPQMRCIAEGQQLEAWHCQKATSLPHEEQQQQQQREPLNLGMTCEEHQKKEKQGLSSTTFPCNVTEGEGHV